MNLYALGWDNHRKFSEVSLMGKTPDGDIRAVERRRLEHDDKQAMRAWLSHLDAEIPVALEATFGWPWVADLLEELGHPVHLAHPPVIRALAKHEAKTDRCDSDRLGKFQLRGILPESYLAPPDVRQQRERTRYRMALSALRTAVKNRAQAVLHRHGILHDFSDLFGKAGRRFLDELALEHELDQVKQRLKETPKHVVWDELPAEQKFDRLASSRKRLTDTVKMIAYRAETAMTAIVREELAREDDARALLRELFRSEADLLPDATQGVLEVRVHPMANPRSNRAIAHLLTHLNEASFTYPGTNLKLVYTMPAVPQRNLSPPEIPRNQEI
ncbi:MAG: putative transposase [Thermoguttaceae bacterium]|jgi:transposase